MPENIRTLDRMPGHPRQIAGDVPEIYSEDMPPHPMPERN